MWQWWLWCKVVEGCDCGSGGCGVKEVEDGGGVKEVESCDSGSGGCVVK